MGRSVGRAVRILKLAGLSLTGHIRLMDFRPAAAALGSAVLFGITTPLAKHLLSSEGPWLTAGLLYLGSGAGLTLWRIIQDRGWIGSGLARSDWPWLAGATLSGGILAPLLLMLGLQRTAAAEASLLLNLEAVFSAALAWMVFREATSRRIVLGFIAICVASVLLAWPSNELGGSIGLGPALVAAACLFWGIDNNLTRKIAAADARVVAALKGLVAGITNTGLALWLGATWPASPALAGTLLLGFAGYGVSLVLFIVSLRRLGTARTGAYFAAAPFIGALLSMVIYGQPAGSLFFVAGALMALGVWLHLSEEHHHPHVHEPLIHTHSHRHDTHHQHEHAADYDGSEPHSHEHHHGFLRHSHAHFPDLHHGHRHD
jgi:drug/metabolite transporter (DMT)-like permease